MIDENPGPGDRFPNARHEDRIDLLHGHAVADPYRWLEDAADPDTVRWSYEQDALFERSARSWSARPWFASAVEDALRRGGATSPPVWRAGRRFFLLREAARPLPRLIVTGAVPGGWRVVVDPAEADPHATTVLEAWRPSWDGRLVVCQFSRAGGEAPVLRIVRVDDGEFLGPPVLPGHLSPVAWRADDAGFFYVTAHRGRGTPRALRWHALAARGDVDDAVLFETDMPGLSVKTSPDGSRMMLSASAGAGAGNRVWLADLDPTSPDVPLRPVLVHDGISDHTRAVVKFAPAGRLHLITDQGAPYGTLVEIDPERPSSRRTLLPSSPPDVLADVVSLSDPESGEPRLLVASTRGGAGQLRLHDGDGRLLRDVALPGTGTVSGLTAPLATRAGRDAWFSYTDVATPQTVHRVALPEAEVDPDPGVATAGPDASPVAIRVEEASYTVADGTSITLHVASPRAVPADPVPLPTLLFAYGGFGASSPLTFAPGVVAWLRAGGRYAVAHVRGGGEEGAAWHEAGRRRHKPNAVIDLLGAAGRLVELGYTTPGRLALRGGSHAGLLAAAALTTSPGSFAAVVCSDALTDMVRYHLVGNGYLWREEFGSADDPDDLEALLAYSPYHRVREEVDEPAVLLTCADTDDRLDAMHTRKMTAALQRVRRSGLPVVLRREAGVGHGARSSARWSALQADILAFCAHHTGLAPAVGAPCVDP